MLREHMDLPFQPGPWPSRLHQVTADAVDILNRLSRTRPPVVATVGGRAVTLVLDTMVASEPEWLALPFTVAKAGCCVRLPEHLAAWSIAPLETWPQEPDPQAFALLLEFAMLDLLAGIEDAGFAPITFGAGGASVETVSIGMRLDAMPLVLELPLKLAASLADHFDRLAPVTAADPAQLPLPLCAEAARQELTLADIRSLRPGDVVMLDRIEPLLTLAGAQAAPLRRSDEGFVLDGHFAPLPQRAPLTGRMDAMDALDDVALDALPLTVVLEFQRLTMTLGEVRALGPGSILALPAQPADQASVDLVANGARIGVGELVRIGEGTGVRIVRLAGTDENARL